MKVGLYSRVSTKYKEQNPENQLIKLREYCRAKDWEYREYVDFASGAKKDRPGMKSVMTDLGSLDGILVLRLDRFGRSLQNLLDNLNTIRSQGKFFEAIDQGLRISAKKDPMNDFMLAILGAAAEFERELISERVRDGMARARKQGKIIGRGLGKKSKKMEARILELAGRGESIRMIAQKCNIPRSTVHGILSRKRNLNRDAERGPGVYIPSGGKQEGTLTGHEHGEVE
nr:recombinase family protein [Ferrimicrobium acidiphilum]